MCLPYFYILLADSMPPKCKANIGEEPFSNESY